MSVRQEAVLLLLTAIVVGLLFLDLEGEPPALRGRRGGGDLELEHYRAPDPARVLARDRSAEADAGRRALFVEPSDTRPLPPLSWNEPRREPLPGLLPPPLPGPSPSRYGAFLRARIDQRSVDLFAGTSGGGSRPADPLADSFDDPFDDEADAVDADSVRRALDELGRRRSSERVAETPEERAARAEGYKRLYDWIVLEPYATLFGSIENDDRYGLFLGGRDEEPILFREFDPELGRAKLPGQPPLAFERERVASFGLARSVANDIELRFRELKDSVSRGSYTRVLDLADEALAARHEAPRGLAIARTLYERLAAVAPEDPTPELGLGACLEAEFDLEGAFAHYRELLERFAHRPEVHVALAELELACLMDEQGLERLREATRVDRTSWLAHWRLGRALLERGAGTDDELLAHLQTANQNAPEDTGYLSTRAEMRVDLASAHLWRGEASEAVRQLERARQLEPRDPRVVAGLLACAYLDPGLAVDVDSLLGDARSDSDSDAGDGTALATDFERLIAAGLHALQRGEFARARERLETATVADPLRAHVAWRALSHLAEVAGLAGEALRFVEQALDAEPRDPWSLYQRGRLLAEAGDVEGALESFRLALEVDLDFSDALAALGELLLDAGRYDESARYLRRALTLEPRRGDLERLLGLGALRSGSVQVARRAFDRALALDPGDPVSSGGLAWCTYLEGDLDRARTRLRTLEDRPEGDPWRAWASAQLARLEDHRDKVEWTDAFERTTLRNGWTVDHGDGPLVELVEPTDETGGEVRISGVFDRDGRARLFREYPASRFVSIEASVFVPSSSRIRAGLFVARERRSQREWQTQSEVSIARHRDGELEIRVERSASDEGERFAAPDLTFPTDRWVRLAIERTGPPERPTVDFWLDGIPVLRGLPFAELGRAAQPVRVGVFARGDAAREALVRVADVRVVHRLPEDR